MAFPMEIEQWTPSGEMRDSTTQGDRWMEALELASEFIPERKWYRELNKRSCEVLDVRTQVLLWNNEAHQNTVEVFLEELLGGVPESLKLCECFEGPVGSCGDICRQQTTIYEFEMSVAGSHRVWLRQMLLLSHYNLFGLVTVIFWLFSLGHHAALKAPY